MSVVILAIGLIVFLAHFFTAVFEKTKIPDVLLLMLIGMIGGPALGLVSPDDFGRFGPVLTTVALIIILFEGGTTLNVGTLGKAIGPTLTLTLLTFVVTASFFAVLCVGMLGFSELAGMTAGAIVGGTSSAVVVPMVRGLRMKDPGGTILILESALTDVLCIVMAFSFLEAFQEGDLTTSQIVLNILKSLGIAMLLGFLGSVAWQAILVWVRRFPNTLFTTFAFIFVLYGSAELLGFSGAITALSFGITMTNFENLGLKKLPVFRNRPLAELTSREKSFYSEMVFLLKTFFFLYLGLSIRFDNLLLVVFGCGAVAGIYFLRLLVTRLVTSRKTEWKDASLISIMVPKGLAAAVLAGLPAQMGMPEGESIQSLTYSVVFFSILTTAVFVPLIDKTALQHLYRRIFSTFADAPAPAPVTADTSLSEQPSPNPTEEHGILTVPRRD